MAKGNILLGYGRGSIGDVVLSRVKGQQVAKARNRKPANPRTEGQMIQRSRFLSAIKFFSRGNQAQFKFAYEGKKSTESDYNAFMRLNAYKGVYITKTQGENLAWPMLGSFVCSKGSLTEVVPVVSAKTQDTDAAYMGCRVSITSQSATVAEVSTELTRTLRVPVGTILTFFALQQTYSTIDENGNMTVLAGAKPVEWLIKQIRLDTTDTRTLEEVGFEIDPTSHILSPGFHIHKWHGQSYAAIGIVASREENGSLKVSTCNLLMNDASQLAAAIARSTANMNAVIADWGAAEKAVLQGGLLPEQEEV